jgi:hypothetical protein
MLELDRAEIVWRLQGRNAGGAVDVRVTTALEMNLITGQVSPCPRGGTRPSPPVYRIVYMT